MVTTLYRGRGGQDAGLEAGGAGAEHRLHRRRAGGARSWKAASVSDWARPSQPPRPCCAKSAAWSRWPTIWATITNWALALLPRDTESELADIVVETALPDYSFRDFWAHQLRWARNVKDRRGAQYFGLIVSFGLVWGVLAVLAAPRAWWTLGGARRYCRAQVCRSGVVTGRQVLADPQVLGDLWLLPLRDLVALAIWVVSYWWRPSGVARAALQAAQRKTRTDLSGV